MDYESDKGFEAKKTDIANSLGKVTRANVFDLEYLSSLKLAFFTESPETALIHHSGQIYIDDTDKYGDVRGFELGIKRDFIPLEDRRSYESTPMQESQRIQELFYSAGIPYEEFIAHELGHNVFDRAYIATSGPFETYGHQDPTTKRTKGIMTEVSAEYRDKMQQKLQTLLTDAQINLNLEKFFGDKQNNRQKIAEIFALTLQRELAKRINSPYVPIHEELESKMRAFLADPLQTLNLHNKKTGTQINEQDFYQDNHTLSFAVAPLLEKAYPDFEQRMKFFELNTENLLIT